MHEFSVASQIIQRALEVAKEKKARRIKSIELAVGELSMLGEEQLKFWLKEMLNKKEIAKGIKIKVNSVKAVVKCKKCGREMQQKDKCQCRPWLCFGCCECGLDCDLCGCSHKK